MWLYLPRKYCPSSQESLDSINQFGLFFQNRELCVSLSGKPTPRPYSWQGWKTRPWMKLLYGVTLQPSTVKASVDAWIASLSVSPVPTSQLQASKKESAKAQDQDSSLKPAELFAKYSQGIFLSKTSQDSFLTSSCQSYSESFSKWGSMRNGECFRQEMWVAPILEKESSSWPTPKSSEAKGGYASKSKAPSLGHMAQHSWPTPCSTEVRQGYQDRSRGKKGSQESLTTVVLKGEQCNNHTGPLAQTKQTSGGKSSTTPPISPQQLRRLNPTFVEWLMGLPTGWSLPIPIDQNDYKLWETVSCHLLALLLLPHYSND